MGRRRTRRFLGRTPVGLEGLEPRLLLCTDLPTPPPDDASDPVASPPADTQPVDTQPVDTQPSDGTDDGDGAGGGDDGGTDTGPVDTVTPAPEAPSRVTLQAPSSSSVFVSWSEPGGEADSFTVQRREAGGRWRKVAEVDGDVEHFTDTSVQAGEVYSYRVFASNEGGNSPTSGVKTILVPGSTDTTLVGQFGALPGGGRSAPLLFTDVDGAMVKVTLSGPGVGTVRVGVRGYDITLEGTTGASLVKITARQNGGDDGRFTLESLTTGGASALRGITAPTTDLDGTVMIGGTASTITLGNVDSGSVLSVGSATTSATSSVNITLGQVSDAEVMSLMAIRSLSVISWKVTAGTGGVSAPSIGTLTVKGARGVVGDFAANLTLTGGGMTLGKVRVAHQIAGGTWTIAGEIGRISAGSIAEAWRLAAGYVAVVRLKDRART